MLWVNGHTHVNTIRSIPGRLGAQGFWEVTTCAVADWPSQARLVEVIDNGDQSLSIACTMLDHGGIISAPDGWDVAFEGDYSQRLAGLHRELAANVPFAGLGAGLEGQREDRNVLLRLPKPPGLTADR